MLYAISLFGIIHREYVSDEEKRRATKRREEEEVVERCCLGVAVWSRTLLLIGCSVFSAYSRSVVRRSQVALAVLILSALLPRVISVPFCSASSCCPLRTANSIPLTFASVKMAEFYAGKTLFA